MDNLLNLNSNFTMEIITIEMVGIYSSFNREKNIGGKNINSINIICKFNDTLNHFKDDFHHYSFRYPK